MSQSFILTLCHSVTDGSTSLSVIFFVHVPAFFGGGEPVCTCDCSGVFGHILYE